MLKADDCAIFDLDGTLVDTAPDLYLALSHVLKNQGLPLISLESARTHVGHGARTLIEHALTETGAVFDELLLDHLLAQYLSYYKDNISNKSKIFPGVIETLSRIQGQGLKLGVCTNKREGLSRQLLDELGLARFFSVVLGSDTLPVCKPDPHHLLETIARAGGHPDRSVMIGDSVTDIATAKAANIPIIAVSFGYAGGPAAHLGSDRIIDHYNQLEATLMDLLT